MAKHIHPEDYSGPFCPYRQHGIGQNRVHLTRPDQAFSGALCGVQLLHAESCEPTKEHDPQAYLCHSCLAEADRLVESRFADDMAGLRLFLATIEEGAIPASGAQASAKLFGKILDDRFGSETVRATKDGWVEA